MENDYILVVFLNLVPVSSEMFRDVTVYFSMILKGLVKTFCLFVPFPRELQTLNIILALMPQSELFPSSLPDEQSSRSSPDALGICIHMATAAAFTYAETG